MHRNFIVKTVQHTCKMCHRGYSSDVIRVRFAPSPTGYLHLGGLRTALYNYLFARSRNGKFILRIEDTDQSRLVDGATEQLQMDLIWGGIEIDEGPDVGGQFGPYIQSKRTELYREQVQTLLSNGSAYYCFCTNKRLELLRKEAIRIRQIPKYDNRCKHLSEDEVRERLERGDPYCIRFKLSTGCETFNDLIYGKISYDITTNESDPVIMKSDGFPTYHFANVVDDHFMKISHVLRGVEWQISTTKHLLLYRAFNWNPPIYGHLPLLINADGTKLSKRQGDVQISYFRNAGILPQAVINFITNSGGGFNKDQERGLKPKSYTMHELINQFDVTKINASSGKLMSERLSEFNKLEIERQLCDEDEEKILISRVQKMVEKKFPDEFSKNQLQTDTDHVRSILKWSVHRISRLSDLISNDLMFLWVLPRNDENIGEDQVIVLDKLARLLFDFSDDFTRDGIKTTLKNFSEQNGIAFSKFMKLLRRVLSGLKEGPSVGEMMEILGKENTLSRLEMASKKRYNR